MHPGLETGASSFQHQIDYFSNHFRVIVPDLRGHGHSYAEDFTNYFSTSRTRYTRINRAAPLRNIPNCWYLLRCSYYRSYFTTSTTKSIFLYACWYYVRKT
ncbi:alpha/beta fold hydrolase [Bacillus sp. S10(2024)]|uniref:alpha/beta fold hydrolase n=1 Tax=Bacillus sp. S10(2024) TaxID=3162886 RepID=UPI003D1C8A77